MTVYLLIFYFLSFNALEIQKKGIKKYNKGKYKEAIESFSKIKNSKKNFDYYFYFGHSHSLIGNNKLAITLYDSAINIDHRNDLIFFERGFSNFVIGNSNQALKDVDKAIKINPNNPKYYVNRGSIKYDLGFVESACEDWNRAIELNSKIINNELIEINCN